MYECRNDIDIFGELARRARDHRLQRQEREGVAARADRRRDRRFRHVPRAGRRALPAPDDAVAFAREIRDPERHPFSTPSGKIEIYSMTLAAKPDPYGLGVIPPIPTWIEDEIDSRYPLRLVTPKSRARTHSIHGNQPILARADSDDVWINTDRRGGARDRRRPARAYLQRAGHDRASGAGDRPDRTGRRLDQGGRLVHAGRSRAPTRAAAPTCSPPTGRRPPVRRPFNSCFVDVARHFA